VIAMDANFTKEQLQTDEGVAELNRLLTSLVEKSAEGRVGVNLNNPGLKKL
jgi:hypothetical protein